MSQNISESQRAALSEELRQLELRKKHLEQLQEAGEFSDAHLQKSLEQSGGTAPEAPKPLETPEVPFIPKQEKPPVNPLDALNHSLENGAEEIPKDLQSHLQRVMDGKTNGDNHEITENIARLMESK